MMILDDQVRSIQFSGRKSDATLTPRDMTGYSYRRPLPMNPPRRSFKQHAKRCFTLFYTSFVIFFAFPLAAFRLLFVDDPPRFPLPESDSPIDCFNFNSSRIWAESSRVKVEVEVGDFLEYPREIASRLLTVVVQGGNMSFSYPWRQFWDLTSDLTHISFCILQAAGGYEMNCSLICHGHVLAANYFDLREINVFPIGWSRMVPTLDGVAHFTDVCLRSDTELIFFSRAATQFPPLYVGQGHVINVSINSNATEIYCHAVNATAQPLTTLFVSVLANDAPAIMVNVIMPLFGAYFHSFHTTDYEIAFTRPELQMNLVPSLEPILRHPVRSVMEETCYTTAIFVRGPGFLRPYTTNPPMDELTALAQHFEYVARFRPEIFTLVRTQYAGDQEIQRGVVSYHESLAMYADDFKAACTQCEFVQLNDSMTVTEVAHIMAVSQVFLSGTLYSNSYGVFMHRNATFIEVPTDGNECTQFGSFFSPPTYITGYLVNDTCTCTVRCYLERPLAHTQVDIDRIKRAIVWGLSR
jgi:hypothetical protein